jgi:hypothetical protein
MKARTMRQLWSFIGQEENRKILGWIGGGLVVVITGLWAAFVYFSDTPKATASTPSVQASCGSVGVGGNVSGATITAGNTGNCPEQKP